MTTPGERATHMLNVTYYRVNCDFLQALGEVAEEVGGLEFADEALTASLGSSNVIESKGFEMLKQGYPDAYETVFNRMDEISKERREMERAVRLERIHPTGLRGLGRRAMRGFASMRLS